MKEPYIREEALVSQLSNMLSTYALPVEWSSELSRMAERDEQEATSVASASIHALRATLADIDEKVVRITDLYVEQDIDRDTYLSRKRILMSERKSVEEQIVRLEHDATAWLQPLREWIQTASMLDGIAKNNDLSSQKSSLQKIFGSNLTLSSREARGVPKPQWAALGVAKNNFSKIGISTLLVRGEGFEPPALPTSRGCSTTELTAQA